MTSLRSETISIPSSPIEVNPLPFFHDQRLVRNLDLRGSFPLELKELIGWQTYDRVLPYRVQDRYSRQLSQTSFKSIILENEWLAAAFLPQMGGRLISLIDKQKGKELVSCNPELQPANLAIRDAWFSGGIEWNVGRYGHSAFTCSPVFASEITDWNGDPGLRLYEFERTQGLFWQIDFFLPRDSRFLISHIRVINPRDEPTSMYWWTNIAVKEENGVRVLAPAQSAIFNDPGTDSLFVTDLPFQYDEADISYPAKALRGIEFFMLTQSADMPWITALDQEGYGLVEASTPRLGARKLFCWGTGLSGRRWQKYLSPSGKPYIELQAGLAPTQLNGLVMPAHDTWEWTEVFGALESDATLVHHEDWNTAWLAVDQMLKQRITAKQLAQIELLCSKQMDIPAKRILHEASGWGALEIKRLSFDHNHVLPPGFIFPSSTMNDEQIRWSMLLDSGIFPEQSAEFSPGEWVTQKEWRHILSDHLKQPGNRNWFALLHLGVMLYEASDEFGAEQAWLESIALQPSIWAFRNLGILYRARNQIKDALRNYQSAWASAQNLCLADQTSLAKEYLQFLFEIFFYDQAMEYYKSLPSQLQMNDRIQIIYGQIALACNDLETVEALLQKEYAVIRENETSLCDMWFEVAARRFAETTGRVLDDSLRAEVKSTLQPPFAISF